ASHPFLWGSQWKESPGTCTPTVSTGPACPIPGSGNRGSIGAKPVSCEAVPSRGAGRHTGPEGPDPGASLGRDRRRSATTGRRALSPPFSHPPGDWRSTSRAQTFPRGGQIGYLPKFVAVWAPPPQSVVPPASREGSDRNTPHAVGRK